MITPIVYTTEAYVSDINGVDRIDISDYVVGGGLDINVDRQIKTNANLALIDMPESLLDPLNDFLHVYTRMEGADGDVQVESRGVFTVDLPEAEATAEGMITDAKLFDKSVLMADQSFNETTNFPIGEYYTEAMIALVEMAGMSGEGIPHDTTKITGNAITYWPDRDLLSAFNELAGAIGFYSMTVDRFGIPESYPYINISSEQPFATLTEDDFVGPIIISPFSPVLPNRVVVYYAPPDAAPLVATENLDDDNPLSAVNRGGRIVTKWVQLNQAASQAVVDATALQHKAEMGSAHTVLSLSILPNPTLRVRDTVDLYLETGDRVYSGRYYVRTQKNGFTYKTSKLDLEIYRTLDYTELAAS